MSFQRKRRLSEVRFSIAEIQPTEQRSMQRVASSLQFHDQSFASISSFAASPRVKFSRTNHNNASHCNVFFKRLKTPASYYSTQEIPGKIEETSRTGISSETKNENDIQEFLKAQGTFIPKWDKESSARRDHSRDSQKLSQIFVNNSIGGKQLNNGLSAQNTSCGQHLKYLPMQDILNYEGEITSNPKLIERRLLHKIKRVFMSK